MGVSKLLQQHFKRASSLVIRDFIEVFVVIEMCFKGGSVNFKIQRMLQEEFTSMPRAVHQSRALPAHVVSCS